jgi:signal peptidase I
VTYEASRTDRPSEPPRRSGTAGLLRTAVLVVLLLVLVPSFVARVYAIPSGSMETTLHGCTGCTDDRVLVDKLTYRFSSPQPGDIVVFVRPTSWNNPNLETAPEPGALLGAAQSLGDRVGVRDIGRVDLIKRVIAVGGQTVSCCDARGRVMVDGVARDEPFVYLEPGFGLAQAPFGPVRVPDGSIWVMGDNRNNSVDSRAPGDGPVPLTDVVGRGRLIVYPFSRLGVLSRPGG